MFTEARGSSGALAPKGRPSRTGWMRLFRTRTPAAVAAATAVVYVLLGTAWAFSSPNYSVPDEYQHAVKAAAVVRGDIRPTSPTVRELVSAPSWLNGGSVGCFVLRPDVTAGCQAKLTESTTLKTLRTTAGRYLPFYYGFAGVPTLVLAGQSALYWQREMTVLVSALLLGLAAWSASATPGSGRVMLALGLAVTPMTIYFMGSVNPQAPEIAAAVGVWISGWALLQSRSRLDTGALVRLTVAACALVLCRPLSVPWLGVIAGLLLVGFARVSHWRMLRERLFAKICAGIVLVASLAGTIWTMSTGALTQGLAGVDMTTADAIRTAMSSQYFWLLGMVGYFGYRVPAWPPVYYVWLLSAGLLLLTALLYGSRRERLALVLVLAASVSAPVAAEVSTYRTTGFAWQGRYILPVAVGVVLMSGMIVSRRLRSIPQARWWDGVARNLVIPLLGAAQFLAFVSALKRYSMGVSSDFPFGDYIVRWEPPGGVWMWITVMGLFCVLFVILLRWVAAGGESGPEEMSGGD